jgi:hypothetical protein
VDHRYLAEVHERVVQSPPEQCGFACSARKILFHGCGSFAADDPGSGGTPDIFALEWR